MKYKTIGAFKNVQNVPYCKAASDMKVGMGVILDRVARQQLFLHPRTMQRRSYTSLPISMISLSCTTALRLML